jgi:hypothetical protein
MTTSLVLVHIERHKCQWSLGNKSTQCAREARYMIGWAKPDGTLQDWKVCYRHRWKLRDYIQEHIVAPAEAATNSSSSKPASA